MKKRATSRKTGSDKNKRWRKRKGRRSYAKGEILIGRKGRKEIDMERGVGIPVS